MNGGGVEQTPLRRPSQPNHSRSNSFFSFRRSNNSVTMPSTSTAPPNANPNPPSAPQPPPQPASAAPAPLPGQAQLHPEVRSVVHLTAAHAHKVYFSGPLIRHIERTADGSKPHLDSGWTDVWAQLGGTTLSIWDMRAIEEANKQGKEVPPSYVNMTDAFVHVLGSVTVPGPNGTPGRRYTDVLTLNTAGGNLLLFSCPDTRALMSWAAALRLSAWEKSRLEEIYTAHLLRITLNGVCCHPVLNYIFKYISSRQHGTHQRVSPTAASKAGSASVSQAKQTGNGYGW